MSKKNHFYTKMFLLKCSLLHMYVITTTLVPILYRLVTLFPLSLHTVRDGRFLGGNTKRLVWLRSIVRTRTVSVTSDHASRVPPAPAQSIQVSFKRLIEKKYTHLIPQIWLGQKI